MLESLLRADHPAPAASDGTLLGALEHASGAIARLDQALDNHPLRTAFLYRTRLEAVRRQAAVDGHGIDPWHLAAVLEGLRLRMDHALRIVDRGQIFEAARTALTLHQWIVEPDFDQEGEIQEAERHLANARGLVGVGEALWSWLDSGRTRPPVRGALVRFWTRNLLLRAPVPLTGPRALSAEAPHGRAGWIVAFLDALASEATDYREMLRSLERGWIAARARVPAQRSTSRAALAVDVIAATPLISATTLARVMGMSIKCTTELLDRFVATEIAVEVTHRSARRLFGLAEMAPMRAASSAPRRPVPGRGRGRPRSEDLPEEMVAPTAPPPPMSRFERPAIDYAALEAAMLECERVIRSTRRSLDGLRQPGFGTERNEKQSDYDPLVRVDCGPGSSPSPEHLVD
ncbi:MAG: hypothetical protein ABSC06_22780 [Rhodopila sp.]|jgi:hypothetical protein